MSQFIPYYGYLVCFQTEVNTNIAPIIIAVCIFILVHMCMSFSRVYLDVLYFLHLELDFQVVNTLKFVAVLIGITLNVCVT